MCGFDNDLPRAFNASLKQLCLLLLSLSKCYYCCKNYFSKGAFSDKKKKTRKSFSLIILLCVLLNEKKTHGLISEQKAVNWCEWSVATRTTKKKKRRRRCNGNLHRKRKKSKRNHIGRRRRYNSTNSTYIYNYK